MTRSRVQCDCLFFELDTTDDAKLSLSSPCVCGHRDKEHRHLDGPCEGDVEVEEE